MVELKNISLGEALSYKQPTNYIVSSDKYDDCYETPVLTAGKSFLLGYTNENEGVYNDIPAIIFDDFTTSFHYVDFPFKVKSSAMKILNTNSNFDIRYLYYRMLGLKVDTQLHKRYWISKFSKLKLDIPPLAEQKRIAAILDVADSYRQQTQQTLYKYNQLTQAIFLDMFGDPVTNPMGWDTRTIEELVVKEKGSIKRGPFGGALKKEIFKEKGYLVYEQYHALNNDFSFERYFIGDDDFERLKGFEVKSGDIIISCSGVYLGKLAIVPDDCKKGIINQALLKLTLDNKIIRNDFFVFHFTQPNFKNKYFESNRGAGIPNFPPMNSFKKFPFIYPPIELQNQFADKIANIEAQKATTQQELAQANNLFNALLQKAFKGQL